MKRAVRTLLAMTLSSILILMPCSVSGGDIDAHNMENDKNRQYERESFSEKVIETQTGARDHLTYIDEKTGTYVEIYDTTLKDRDVEIQVEIIIDGEEYENLTEAFNLDAILYEVILLLDGEPYQPIDGATMTLTIPDQICGYYSMAYVVEEDGTLTQKSGYGVQDYEFVGWQHVNISDVSFGKFLVVGPHMYGDLNWDCEITAEDALMVLKSVVHLIRINENMKETADVDDDGQVTAEDALRILKNVVGIESLPINAQIPE